MMKKIIILTIIVTLLLLLVSTCGNLMNNILDEITEGKSDVLAGSPEGQKYKITYDANEADSGTVPVDSNVYEEGAVVTVPGNSGSLVLDGYFFTGWSLAADGSGDNYKENDTFAMGTADVTFFARWASPSKIIASDGAMGDKFGCSVAVSGDYAVIGANEDDDNGDSSGSAYIYHRTDINTWVEQQKLIASDGAVGDEFGYSVGISGDYVIIGARWANSAAGSAYIYHRDGTAWGSEEKLTALILEGGDFFGHSVALSGDYAIVGAYGDDDNGANSGAAYIYHRTGTNTWGEEQKLTAAVGAAGDDFGHSVAISGDYAVVGAWRDDSMAVDAGAAYIYHRTDTNIWDSDIPEKLYASDPEPSDDFGSSVSISGDNVIVGSCYDDDNGDTSGSAYIYHRTGINTWDMEEKLIASDGAAIDFFGYSVAISGDHAIVGAYGTNNVGLNSGSAYLYHRTGFDSWGAEQILNASDATEGDDYGWSVALFDDYAVVGANADDNGDESGSAWVIQYR